MSERERSPLPSGLTRFALEAGFIILVGVVAALLDLSPLAIVVVMGIAWVAVALFERAAGSSARPRRARPPRPEPASEAPEAAPEAEPRWRKRFVEQRARREEPELGLREWNLWELERRAREHVGSDAVPEEWAAIFMHLREFAKSDGALPSHFDSLVRESFPELTRTAT